MKKTLFMLMAGVSMVMFTACKDAEKEEITDEIITMPEWYFAGGKLGTTSLNTTTCFEQMTPATENAGMADRFDHGDILAEKSFNSNPDGVRHGLGPVYVRSSCQHCHPVYSHGTSVPEGQYETSTVGNGTLLVVYDPTTDAYVTWLAGMPQLHAVRPFKAPLDESQINVHWLTATDGWGNQFPDGETYELQYPEVTIPASAVYAARPEFQEALQALGVKDYDVLANETWAVRLENTIAVYGSGLLDAITDEDIIAQYQKEYEDGYMQNGLNPAYYDGHYKNYYGSNSDDNSKGYGVKRFTYALTRGPLQDGAGANAIWNIPNVTRSDRRYHYLDLNGKVYATCAANDPEVQAGFEDYISKIDPNKEHADWWTDKVSDNIFNYITSKELPVEMTDAQFTSMMVWHRGLAVPAARNVDNPRFERGRVLFEKIGCAYCHRPTWTTGADEIRDPNGKLTNADMPRYPYQKIWPYTDMVQHKLMMENDIRTGWCRTTPLWGRGLHQKATGDASQARLHDTRARNVIEAIMWHGYSTQSDAYRTVEQFRELPKEDRDCIVFFLNSI